MTVKATKTIHPEKRDNVFDTKFQKDWFQSCDEAEQQKIGQCSYFCFRLMSGIFPVVMLLLFFYRALAWHSPFGFCWSVCCGWCSSLAASAWPIIWITTKKGAR